MLLTFDNAHIFSRLVVELSDEFTPVQLSVLMFCSLQHFTCVVVFTI